MAKRPAGMTMLDINGALARRRRQQPRSFARPLKLIDWLAGDRVHLARLLFLADDCAEKTTMLAALASRTDEGLTLQTLLERHQIQTSHFLRMLEEARIREARLTAAKIVADHLPGVTLDAMRAGATHTIVCPSCHGQQTVPKLVKDTTDPEGKREILSEVPCTQCQGTGSLLDDATTEDRRIALELGGMLKQKGGGINVAVQQNNSTNVGKPELLSDLIDATDRVLQPLRAKPSLDGEVLDAPRD